MLFLLIKKIFIRFENKLPILEKKVISFCKSFLSFKIVFLGFGKKFLILMRFSRFSKRFSYFENVFLILKNFYVFWFFFFFFRFWKFWIWIFLFWKSCLRDTFRLPYWILERGCKLYFWPVLQNQNTKKDQYFNNFIPYHIVQFCVVFLISLCNLIWRHGRINFMQHILNILQNTFHEDMFIFEFLHSLVFLSCHVYSR